MAAVLVLAMKETGCPTSPGDNGINLEPGDPPVAKAQFVWPLWMTTTRYGRYGRGRYGEMALAVALTDYVDLM
jgi:hypothetical protein